MRAGLAMLHPASNYLGSPETSFLMGIRDKNTGEATVSWLKRSSMVDKQHIVILDPLIATGGTLHGAFKVLRDYSSDHPPITVFSCYASPEGIRSVLEEGRNITLVVGCVAESMDKNGWLSPPTNGDVGDKLYGPVLTG
jgi:uracil phosphoribosyltransferase